jgi:hypothetical protein
MPPTTGILPNSFASYPNNTLAYDMNRPACSTWYHKPRGSWQLLRDLRAGQRCKVLMLTCHWSRIPQYTCQFSVVEPLLISPFRSGCQDAKQGIYRIQNMTFQMNMLPDGKPHSGELFRLLRAILKQLRLWALTDHNSSSNSTRLKPSDMLESRNVVPYYSLPV